MATAQFHETNLMAHETNLMTTVTLQHLFTCVYSGGVPPPPRLMHGLFGGYGMGGMVQVRSAQPVRRVQLELPSTNHRYPDAQYAAELVYTCVWGLGLGLPHAVQGEPRTESIISASALSE